MRVTRETLIATAVAQQGWAHIIEEMDKTIEDAKKKLLDSKLTKEEVWDVRQKVLAMRDFKQGLLHRINQLIQKVQDA